jgi:hypothetical protein
MNILKAMGDMRDMVAAAPGLIESANQLQANAQAQGLVAQQGGFGQAGFPQAGFAQAGFAQPAGGQAFVNQVNAQEFGEPLPGNLEPIAGVTLERYATIVKGIAAYGYDQSKLVQVAAANGVAAGDWLAAQDGWSARIQADRAVGSRFNQLYTAG